ncbi:MAG: hypothetical protein LC723_14550 [Actinobacteria bacterium]|nr:hypothetical protein [Actinomycetota bacterium]
MKFAKPGQIVQVEWADAASPDAGWTRIEEAAAQNPMDVLSVGFVLRHDKTALVICLSVSKDEQVIMPLAIPSVWVRKIKRLS